MCVLDPTEFMRDVYERAGLVAVRCRRCETLQAEGFFDDDGIWVSSSQVELREMLSMDCTLLYCQRCADSLMALAEETQRDYEAKKGDYDEE